jgi:hypothetical protein
LVDVSLLAPHRPHEGTEQEGEFADDQQRRAASNTCVTTPPAEAGGFSAQLCGNPLA